MVSRKFDIVIDSRELFKKKQFNINSQYFLDMRGDKRLDDLVNDVKSEMAKSQNHWQVPKDEDKICNYITERMHDKKYYGPYDEKTSRDLKAIGVIESRIEKLHEQLAKEKETDPAFRQQKKRLAQLEAEDKKEDDALSKYSEKIHITPLRDTKIGGTDCFKEASIASYVMESVGLHNDLCFGVGGRPKICHVFVQSQNGKFNIIDATGHDKVTRYMLNDNGGRVAKEEVVITDTGFTYGGGKVPKDFDHGEYKKQWIEAGKPTDGKSLVEVVVKANWKIAESELVQRNDKKIQKMKEDAAKQSKVLENSKAELEQLMRADAQGNIGKLDKHVLDKARQHGKAINKHEHNSPSTNYPKATPVIPSPQR